MIDKTYTGDISDIDFGKELYFKPHLCFTEMLAKAKELKAKIIIRTTFIDLQNRGKYIITGFSKNISNTVLKKIRKFKGK